MGARGLGLLGLPLDSPPLAGGSVEESQKLCPRRERERRSASEAGLLRGPHRVVFAGCVGAGPREAGSEVFASLAGRLFSPPVLF